MNHKLGNYKCVLKKVEMSERLKQQQGTWIYAYIKGVVEDINIKYARKGWPFEKCTPSDKIKGTDKEDNKFGLKFAKKRLFLRVFSEIYDMMEHDFDKTMHDVLAFKNILLEVEDLRARLKDSILIMYAKAAMNEGDTECTNLEDAIDEQFEYKRKIHCSKYNIKPGVTTDIEDVTKIPKDEDRPIVPKDEDRPIVYIYTLTNEGIDTAAAEFGLEPDKARDFLAKAYQCSNVYGKPMIVMDEDVWGDDDE